MTPEANKNSQSSQQYIDVITPKQTIQEKSIVSRETIEENVITNCTSKDNKGKPFTIKGNVADNDTKDHNNNDDDDDVSENNDTDIENKPKVGKRELDGLMFSKHYGEEKLNILDPHESDTNQRSTRKKLQLNDNGVAHGK